MSYIPQDWVDDETPVDAVHMRHIEDGVLAASKQLSSMKTFLDHNGDTWLVANATLAADGVTWNRIDTTKFAYAVQFIVNGIIPGEEGIDPIGGICWWRCVPGANPIGAFAAFGGWENMYVVTQYRDFAVGGMGIEVDGAGTFPFGRFIHDTKGTWLTTNAYTNWAGRDDATQDSFMLGVFANKVAAKFWPANQDNTHVTDLFTVDSAGHFDVKGSFTVNGAAVPAPPSYGTTLPAGPVNGQEAILVDSVTNPTYQWRFRYNAGSTSPYKWEFIGGTSAYAEVPAAENTVTSGSWIELATVGPRVIVPRAGDYDVLGTAQASNTIASSFSHVGISRNAGVPLAYVSAILTGTAGYPVAFPTASARLTAVAANDDIRLRYQNASAGTTASWQNRWIRVTPVRVA